MPAFGADANTPMGSITAVWIISPRILRVSTIENPVTANGEVGEGGTDKDIQELGTHAVAF